MRWSLLLSFVCALIGSAAAPARAAFPVSDPAELLRATPQRFATTDFNGDGRVDLLSAGADFQLRLGTARGPAAAQVMTLSGVDGMTALASAELTGDAYEDVLVAVDRPGKVVVLRGRADGVLTAPPAEDVYQVVDALPAGNRPVAIAAGDVDGDGDLDVAAGFGTSADYGTPPSSADAGTITILTNDGRGALTTTAPVLPVNAPARVMLLALAGDSDPELVVAQANKPAAEAIKVFPGATGATFGAPQSFSSGAGAPSSVGSGDFDEDGLIDLAVAHAIPASPALSAPVDVLFGDPTATFGTPVPIPGSHGDAIAVGDLDRDGHDDLYLAAGTTVIAGDQPRPAFLRGRGNGMFGAPERASTTSSETNPRIDDLNDDGLPDVVSLGDAGFLLRYGLRPRLEPDPRMSTWASQVIGARSPAHTIRFVNKGPSTATDVRIVMDGDIEDYPIADDRCAGRRLAIDELCEVDVAFAPTRVGDRRALIGAGGRESDTIVSAVVLGHGFMLAADRDAIPVPTPTPTPTPMPRGPGADAPITFAYQPKVASITRRLLARRGLRFSQRFGFPGVARWALEALGGRRVVIGRANQVIRKPGIRRVRLRLGPAGRRYLARHPTVSLRLRTSFTPTGGTAIVLRTRVPVRSP